MASIRPLLMRGEILVHEERISPIAYTLPLVLFIFLMLAWVAAKTAKMGDYLASLGNGGLFADVSGILEIATSSWGALILVCVFALWICAIWVKRKTTLYGVTNRRILKKTGLINRDIAEMRLEKIESIMVKQDVAGRIFNYGDVVACGTGDTRLRFNMISDPIVFRHKIEDALPR